MGMFRHLLMAVGQGSSTNVDADLSEVYSYANTFGISRSAVNAKITEKPFLRSRLIAWKYLLHSLFNTGYTPWLKGDGVAYIDTGIVPTNTDIIDSKIKVDDVSSNRIFWGMRQSGNWDSYDYNQLYANRNGRRFIVTYGGTENVVDKGVNIGDVITTRISVANYVPSNIQYSYSYYLLAMNNKGAVANKSFDSISHWQVNNKKFVPYLDNGKYGMLDLVSGNFYGSAAANGRFSYELWDSNNNVVNIN